MDAVKKIKGNMIRKIMKCALTAVLLLSVLFLFSGCREKKQIILTTGFKKNEVFRIDTKNCLMPEVMVYLTNMQNQYESIYGEEIWATAKSGSSMEEQAKEQVLAELAQIKAMVLLAESKGIVLTEMEEDRVTAAAREYYDSLTETEISVLGADKQLLESMYREYALAQKVYAQIIGSVNPEISDDEARTITVLAMRLKTQDEARTAMEEIQQEGADFMAIAERVSEDTEVTFSFGKGERDAAVEKAAFELGKEEVSGIIRAEDGFYILKCINTFDEAQTKANKERILQELKSEAFASEYTAFVDTLPRQLNEEVWNQVVMIQDEAVTTGTFFAVYDRFFTVE